MIRRGDPGGREVAAEAAKVAAAIARLRRRLQDPRLLAEAGGLSELRKLEDQLVPHLSVTRSPGRHRSGIRHDDPRRGRQVEDVEGYSTKPDPLTATTARAFMEALRQYRDWAGKVPYRDMATRAGQVCVHSTMHAAMQKDQLPRLEVLKAIMTGCGASPEDIRAFVTAWRRIESGQAGDPAGRMGLLPAPVPVLTLVRG